jgi:hypothetical protein
MGNRASSDSSPLPVTGIVAALDIMRESLPAGHVLRAFTIRLQLEPPVSPVVMAYLDGIAKVHGFTVQLSEPEYRWRVLPQYLYTVATFMNRA